MKPGNTSIRTSAIFALLTLAHICFVPYAHSAECCGGEELTGTEACCNDEKYEPADDKACCNDEGTYDPSIREGSFSVGATATDYMKSKLSSALNVIPGLENLEITGASATFTKTIADCCPDEGASVSDGQKGAVGSASLSAKVDHLPIWPQGGLNTQEAEKTILGNYFKVMVNIGSFFDIDLTTTASLGYLDNTCEDKVCYYGSIDFSTTLSAYLQLEAIVCEKWIGQSQEECVEVNITPANITCPFGVTGTWHEGGDCDKDWNGNTHAGPLEVSTSIDVGIGTFNKVWFSWGPV
ncbi:MAG: hypothetical protein IAE94_06970 [Chthoniobacterales bacterium]|nr:hypothetical protein [Chthoniobacterales bacterium]